MTLLNNKIHMGLDVGSTTVKLVVADGSGKILFKEYKRHYSDVRKTMCELLAEVAKSYLDKEFTIAVAGSGGISVSRLIGIEFVQEVIASTAALRRIIPETDVAIELGGEDAKITFFDSGVDQRMNETCAGGTGAFIDQMASVLETDAAGLNELAKSFTTLYPIAARCGVFAKTDVMPLLNEGAPKNDIAASIFQAVVDQTVGGLACGRSIRGSVAFLGGPLHFLSELRRRFIDTLKLAPEDVLFPENAQYFVAIGASILSEEFSPIKGDALLERVNTLINAPYDSEAAPLPPLFNSPQELEAFSARHAKDHAEFVKLEEAEGNLYLGIDAGSTTTKAVLIDEQNRIAYTWYGSNKGTPLLSVVEILKDLYEKLPYNSVIHNSAATGYGESLLQAALGIDEGEVETLVHCKAAAFFAPDVSFILDIGGQDMKCLYVKNGAVDKIVLNEACSSGCGSFVETFAKSLSMGIAEFSTAALTAKTPVDLGSRCTVFMNSKVKQAQKEGASVADISAGLSYSVIKNALYKVIKIARPEELGHHVVVQGGTFFNNAILRALELLVGRDVTRPDIAGLMGAFGAALLAKENSEQGRKSTIITPEMLKNFTTTSKNYRCNLCSNKCLITVNTFSGGKRFVSGNRCERGAGKSTTGKLPNLFTFKYNRLFEYYVPLPKDKAKRGEIGIPRVLNMYENYPFWFTFFTKLGYHVVLSGHSTKTLFNTGLETIPSQTVCYPAKLAHGHIIDLLSRGVKRIFYPAIPFEREEFADADNHFNCPVVANYPEVIRLNVDDILASGAELVEPYLPLYNLKRLTAKLYETFKADGVTRREAEDAVRLADEELSIFKREIQRAGENALNELKEKSGMGIILAGRPYHLDPEINHGIPELIASNNVTVFTEDSLSHLGKLHYKLDAVDQWMYHSRLYRVANLAADTREVELVQLNSFGCGLDAVTTEQVEEILESAGKSYTLIKIDEGSNLGAARIRIRSLIATMKDRLKKGAEVKRTAPKRAPEFTSDMKPTHTILCPQLSPIHFTMLADCLAPLGYNLEVLPTASKEDVEEGLKYVNNDACFPAITVVGQLINALKSGKYDLNSTSLIISQTGGGCRATNYVRFLKAAAARAGYPHIPVIPFNMGNFSPTGGFVIERSMVQRMLHMILYGDVLLRVTNRTRPYELVPGDVDALAARWTERLRPAVRRCQRKEFIKNVQAMVEDFDRIPIREGIVKPKVGVVGEILVKFHPNANNHLVRVIEEEGGEAVVPDFMDFVIYCSLDDVHQHELLAGSWKESIKSKLYIAYIEWHRNAMRKAFKKSRRFSSFLKGTDLAALVDGIVSKGNQTGEGWLLTAEMVELIEGGAPNVVLVQPFACLPNHITGKGVMKELKRRYKEANIVAVDYDPGASEVNQLNRIKLMMSVAFQNLTRERELQSVV